MCPIRFLVKATSNKERIGDLDIDSPDIISSELVVFLLPSCGRIDLYIEHFIVYKKVEFLEPFLLTSNVLPRSLLLSLED